MGGDPVRDDGHHGLGDAYCATHHFAGVPESIGSVRAATEEFLAALVRQGAPASPSGRADLLLVVTELAVNAVQYAPGPFTLRLRRTFDGVHVMMRDTNPAVPVPRPPVRAGGTRGLGWCLIATLADQVCVLPDRGGKDIHAFLSW